MSQLQIKSGFPIGIAWSWVKFSFAVFREKPINFLFFAFMYVAFALFPFLGSFLAVLVLSRIYLSAHRVIDEIPFDLNLSLGLIVRRRNILAYGLFNMLFDLILMSLLSEFISSLGIDPANKQAMMSDPRVLNTLMGLTIFRVIFFGVSLPIVIFNSHIRVFESFLLSWKFLLKNFVVIILGLFLLLPLIALPIYIMLLVLISVNNIILFAISFTILVIFILIFILIITIFSYKLYLDGFTNE